MKLNFWIKTIILLFFSLSLASCSTAGENLWLKSPDWSRGVYLGDTKIAAPASFVSDADGNTYIILVDFNEETTNYSFDLVKMRVDSEELVHNELSFGVLQSVKQPELVVDDNNKLRLFWIASDGLYTSIISDGGSSAGESVLLSGSDAVSSYDIVSAPDGRISIWYAGSRRNPGIYALSGPYDENKEGVLMDPAGLLVRLRYDEIGQLHTAWVHYPYGYGQSEILYGVYDEGTGRIIDGSSLVLPVELGPTTSLDDFALGIDDSNVYLLWTTNVHAGPQSGDIQANYESFPIGKLPNSNNEQPILAPAVYDLEFVKSSSSVKTGERVSTQELNVPMTTRVQDFRTNVSPSDELILAFRSPAEHLWRKSRQQVNLVYFNNGSLSAYQPLTFTSTASSYPNVVIEQDGYVSVSWLEKVSSEQFSVYFASTDPQFVDKFDTMSTGEILGVVYATLFGMLIGALLAPITAGVWLIAPIIVLALFSFVRRLFPPRFREYLSVASVIIAIGAVWFTKLAVFPQMFEYIPFSAWIPNISALLGEILRVAVPLFTLLFSGFIAWHFTYRRGNSSSLYFMLIYVGVDALITMSIYAVLYYGTYVQ